MTQRLRELGDVDTVAGKLPNTSQYAIREDDTTPRDIKEEHENIRTGSSLESPVPPGPRRESQRSINRNGALALLMTPSDDDCNAGESSTIALIRQVAPDVIRKEVAQERTAPPAFPLRDKSKRIQPPLFSLPPKTHADDFVRCFWKYIHPVFPVLHRPTFMSSYQSVWGRPAALSPDEIDVQAEFLPMLNLVFALGLQFSGYVADGKKTSEGEMFYQKSKDASVEDVLDSTTLESVQLLLLSAVYLQSTSHAYRCWNTVGLAVRAAQGAGFHRDSSDTTESQLDREMRRRVWHLCMSLDRLVSMTFGRSPISATSTTAVNLPALIDDENLSTVADHPATSSTPSYQISCFVYCCKLFDILHEVLSRFYTEGHHTVESLRSSTVDSIPDILRLNNQLDHFLESLPIYLRPEGKEQMNGLREDVESSIQFQQEVLHARFLYVRVLLLRPLLLSTLSESTSNNTRPPSLSASNSALSNLNESTIRQACELCVLTAQQLLQRLYASLDSSARVYGWHCVYFTFSSSVILLSCHRSSALKHNINDDALSNSWLQAMAILNRYEQHITSSGRAIKLLEALKRQLVRDANTDVESTDKNGVGDPGMADEKHSSTFDNSSNHANIHGETQDATLDAELPSFTAPPLVADWSSWFSMNGSNDASTLENDWFNDNFINLDFLELSRYTF